MNSFIRNVATWWEIYHQFWFSISTSLGFWIQDGYLRKFHLKAFHNARRAWHIVSSSHLKRKYMFEKRTFSQVLCDKMSLKRNPIILVDNPLSWRSYTVKKSFLYIERFSNEIFRIKWLKSLADINVWTILRKPKKLY